MLCVGILGWTTEEFDSRQEVRDLSLLQSVKIGSEARPASYRTNSHDFFSPGVKRPKRDDDHSPPTSTKIKCSYNSIAPYAVVACRRTMLALANCVQIDS